MSLQYWTLSSNTMCTRSFPLLEFTTGNSYMCSCSRNAQVTFKLLYIVQCIDNFAWRVTWNYAYCNELRRSDFRPMYLHWYGLRLRCQFLWPCSASLLLNPLSHISHLIIIISNADFLLTDDFKFKLKPEVYIYFKIVGCTGHPPPKKKFLKIIKKNKNSKKFKTKNLNC